MQANKARSIYMKLLIGGVLILGALVGSVIFFSKPDFYRDSPRPGEQAPFQAAHSNSLFDLNNPRDLMGFSDEVLVAKITEESAPTEFKVSVVFNIKGKSSSSISIEDSRSEALKIGYTYILPLKEDRGRFLVVAPGQGYEQFKQWLYPITTDVSLSLTQLKNLAISDNRTQELLIAYVYETEIQRYPIKNSFKSLSAEERKAVLGYIKNMPSEPPVKPENTKILCSDHEDNDGDHHVDLADNDCAAFLPPKLQENTKALCSDGIDSDRDGLYDLIDPDCSAYKGPEETTEFCSDGLDNDMNGYRDMSDSNCKALYQLLPPPSQPNPPVVSTSTTST
jgi:hypothetical protein